MVGSDGSTGADRTAIVTGGGSGIGRAIALRFAEDGYTVICADINLSAAVTVVSEIEALGGEAHAIECDIADEESVSSMAAATLSTTGRIDAVAANAGIMVEGGILSLTLEDWRRALDVNATGAFLTARATLPHIRETKGALVFTASTVALSGMKGVAAYSAAKGATVALTRQLAADFAADGVRVNAVAPGAVRTPLSEAQFRARSSTAEELEAQLSQVIQRYPLSRWGRTQEIAETVHFLGTNRSSWITGQVIPVDGGLLELR